MRCPCCGFGMSEVVYEGVHIHSCGGCGGEFLGGEELAHIVRVREMTFCQTIIEEMAQREPTFGIPEEDADNGVNCPACGECMDVINYCVDTGIVVDRCTECQGLWLDNEELEKVQALMERWQDEAPAKIRAVAEELAAVRKRSEAGVQVSRFAFVNALIDRIARAA